MSGRERHERSACATAALFQIKGSKSNTTIFTTLRNMWSPGLINHFKKIKEFTQRRKVAKDRKDFLIILSIHGRLKLRFSLRNLCVFACVFVFLVRLRLVRI